MTLKPPILLPALFSLLLVSNLPAADIDVPYPEREFIEEFAGKDSAYIREHLGEPDDILTTSNSSGKIEFWIYSEIVRQGSSEKVYKYTQIGIVNDVAGTMGNTNRKPR